MLRPLTPKEFKERIELIIYDKDYDVEISHTEIDTEMEDLLISLGYEEGIHLIRNTERWYG